MIHQEIRDEIKHIIDNYELDFDTLNQIVDKLRNEVDLSFIRHQHEMRDKHYSPLWDREFSEEKKKEILHKTGLAGYIQDLNKPFKDLLGIEKRKICILLKSENIEPDTDAYLSIGPYHPPRCRKCWHNDPAYVCVSNEGGIIKIKCSHCGDISEKY